MALVLAHSLFCFWFSRASFQVPLLYWKEAKQALSHSAKSVCQVASIGVQYFLKNNALRIISRSAGAAFGQKMCLDT